MLIEFFKYQGTGNDFIVINNFTGEYKEPSTNLIQKMCDRKFGIGADGLMLIEKSGLADFKLIFFNPDGSESFCGNGSRCAVKFVYRNEF
jgi:diaminopimelate epimerase